MFPSGCSHQKDVIKTMGRYTERAVYQKWASGFHVFAAGFMKTEVRTH